MRSSSRRTVAVFAALALLALGTPLPAAGGAPAAAGQRDEIVFRDGGTVLGVRCSAVPEVSTVTVPPEATLRLVNRTGGRARLVIDDEVAGELPAGAAGEVLVRRGPVRVVLEPLCLFAAGTPLSVQVVPELTAPTVLGAASGPGPAAGTSGGAGGGVAASAEPVGWIEPARDRGPLGLLALVATVCVIGVFAGAIRAILAQHPTRPVVT
ncbi:hypothetical protein [Melissospora conviva]|uniref:hypothetical protein n=1 Tax=Melissospora conviva TaxID=3388432 RepID=UPI003B7BB456